MMLSAQAGDSKLNKVAAHWARKIANRNTRKTGILDSGATSGAGPEEDADKFEDTGERSTKTFMFPDQHTATATQKMMLKHDLRDGTPEMNIVPGMHTSLISISKMADAGYTTVLRQDGAEIYDNKTTIVKADAPPVITAPRCLTSRLWKMALDPQKEASERGIGITLKAEQASAMFDMAEQANVIFDLPSSRQSFLCYHASAGWPPKETFLSAVRHGNYTSWPKLTTTMIHRYMPDSDETIKGHIKGQRQGIQSTRVNNVTPYDKDEDEDTVRIKIEARKDTNLFESKPARKISFFVGSSISVKRSTRIRPAPSHTRQSEATDTSWSASILTRTIFSSSQ
jgi:hypothetical protein